MNLLKNTFIDRPKNVQHGLQPIYYYSRCVGLWPFTITYNSDGSIKDACVDLFDCLWFLISICLHLTALYSSCDFVVHNRPFSEQNLFSHLIFFIHQIPPLLFGAVCIVLDMFNRNRLANIIKKFTIFDKEVWFDFCKKQKQLTECMGAKPKCVLFGLKGTPHHFGLFEASKEHRNKVTVRKSTNFGRRSSLSFSDWEN